MEKGVERIWVSKLFIKVYWFFFYWQTQKVARLKPDKFLPFAESRNVANLFFKKSFYAYAQKLSTLAVLFPLLFPLLFCSLSTPFVFFLFFSSALYKTKKNCPRFLIIYTASVLLLFFLQAFPLKYLISYFICFL